MCSKQGVKKSVQRINCESISNDNDEKKGRTVLSFVNAMTLQRHCYYWPASTHSGPFDSPQQHSAQPRATELTKANLHKQISSKKSTQRRDEKEASSFCVFATTPHISQQRQRRDEKIVTLDGPPLYNDYAPRQSCEIWWNWDGSLGLGCLSASRPLPLRLPPQSKSWLGVFLCGRSTDPLVCNWCALFVFKEIC